MDIEQLTTLSIYMLNDYKNEIEKSALIDCGPRLELVCKCINISFEHAIAINTLFSSNLTIPALTLLRIQFESVVRAYWLLFVATNSQILKLEFKWTFEEQLEKDNYPTVSKMINELNEANLQFIKHIIQMFLEFKKYHLTHLNSFIHSGKQAFVRNAVGFNSDFIKILIKQSNNLSALVAQIIFEHSNQKQLIHSLHEKHIKCFYRIDEVDVKMKKRFDSYKLKD